MKLNIKKEKGITLIALVLTILILLILSIVTISALSNNGILEKVNYAKTKAEIAKEKEVIELSAAAFLNKEYNKEDLKKEIIKNAEDENIEVFDNGDGFIIEFSTVKRTYKYSNGQIEGPIDIEKAKDVAPGDITKDENGNDLDGSKEKPYEINCIEDLVSMSGKQYSNKYIILKRDLNFKSELSYIDGKIDNCNSIEELKDKLISGTGFKPIGVLSNTTFDGNNKKIENIYINSDTDAALFLGEQSSDIKNINIYGEISSKNGIAAGIVTRGNGIVENCKNFATITSGSVENYNGNGGICGFTSGIINRCINYANVMSLTNSGGICGNLRRKWMYS